jgi:hypothetical protein
MILDIDHIGYCSVDFDKDMHLLQRLGFSNRFVQRDVKNQNIKKHLLRSFTAEHHLALYDREYDISIEIINYPCCGQKTIAQSSFFPLIENQEVSLLDQLNQNNTLKHLSIKVTHIPSAINFWKMFGFRVVDQAQDYVILCFNSLLKRCDYFIHAKLHADIPIVYLDNSGFTSLALITSSAAREREALERQKINVTPIQNLVIGSRNLSIFFVESPDAHIVEVIGLDDKNSEGKHI